MTTDPRDPVADLIALVERGAFVQGRQHPTLVAKLRWLLIGVVLGIVSTLWWAAAAAQVPPEATSAAYAIRPGSGQAGDQLASRAARGSEAS